jgi:hypothetical protein
VAVDISHARARYRVLDTTRAYAIGKLDETGELDLIARRHAAYYLTYLQRDEGEAPAGNAAERLAAYALEIDNLRAALDWAFSPAGDRSLAVSLTAAANPLWLRLSQLEECGNRARQALAILATLDASDPREEMILHMALGASAPDGPEMASAFTRVLDIAKTLNDPEYQLRALRGLYFQSHTRNQFRDALSFAQAFYNLAASKSNKSDRLVGERMLGSAKSVLGDLAGARHHLEQALAGYSTPDLGQAAVRFDDVIRFLFDGKVAVRVFLTEVLWHQGFSDQAFRMAEEGLAEAQAIGHVASQCFALASGSCLLALWTGNLSVAADYTRLLVDLSTKHGLSHWVAFGARYRRVIALKGGNVDNIAETHLSDAHFRPLTASTEIAGALAKAGRRAEGLTILDGFAALSQELGVLTPEFWRVRGELLLLQTAPPTAKPSEDLFRQALDVAHQHGALSFELRAATSLARLLHDQRRQAEATACLQSVYDRFTEGFATSDLIAAKHLLDELDSDRH